MLIDRRDGDVFVYAACFKKEAICGCSLIETQRIRARDALCDCLATALCGERFARILGSGYELNNFLGRAIHTKDGEFTLRYIAIGYTDEEARLL